MAIKIAIFTVLLICCSSTVITDYLKNVANLVNKQQTKWVAGHNAQWDGMDMDAIQSLMGSLIEPEWVKLPPLEIKAPTALPTNFDSREAWPNCQSIKEIRDQSNCGSCWAFGAAEAMSDRICIHSNQIRQDRISTQDITSCCGLTCGMGCSGGYPSGAWNYFKNRGVVTGNLYGDNSWCYPYAMAPCDHHTTGQYEPCTGEKATPKCSKECAAGYPGAFSTDKKYGKSAYSISGELNIMSEIMTNGPVQASFTVYEDFLTYKYGVYEHTTGSGLGGHAIKIIGWGDEAGIPYWLVANSWNNDWGMDGGENECGIESGAVAGIPNV